MVRSLEGYYRKFVEARSDEIINSICSNNCRYQRLSNDIRKSINELLTKLPVGQKVLLYEYEGKKNEQIALMMELIYAQGLQDGIYIKARQGKKPNSQYVPRHI